MFDHVVCYYCLKLPSLMKKTKKPLPTGNKKATNVCKVCPQLTNNFPVWMNQTLLTLAKAKPTLSTSPFILPKRTGINVKSGISKGNSMLSANTYKNLLCLFANSLWQKLPNASFDYVNTICAATKHNSNTLDIASIQQNNWLPTDLFLRTMTSTLVSILSDPILHADLVVKTLHLNMKTLTHIYIYSVLRRKIHLTHYLLPVTYKHCFQCHTVLNFHVLVNHSCNYQ